MFSGFRWRRRSVFVLSMLSLVAARSSGALADKPPSDAPPSLFDSHEVLYLEIHAPLRELALNAVRADKPATSFEPRGTIALQGGPAISMTAGVFGKSRLGVCSMPPLVLELDPLAARSTPFEGHIPLRIVTHCGHQSGSDRWALLEYLVYRAYQIVADTSLSVRLAEIEYHDTGRRGSKQMAYGFFTEDINLAAKRRGLEWLTISQQAPSHIDSFQTTILALFQYMIGNTDWSALKGPKGERCCHNMAVLGHGDSPNRELLPFDFDQAGLVNAPYARPSARVHLRDVKQRRYRGFCRHNDQLPAVIDRFNQRRPLIEELFTDASLRHPKARKMALRYLQGFFDEINNPKRLTKNVLERCRVASTK